MAKALKDILTHLFMKIMEMRRKRRWKVTGCMWGGKWRKIMENEENRGLIHKNALEDQLVTFCQFSKEHFHYSLSLSLSYSWTLEVFLEHFGIGVRKAKKERGNKDQEVKGRIKHLKQASLQVSTFMCIFLYIFGMHVISCGSLLSWHGFF